MILETHLAYSQTELHSAWPMEAETKIEKIVNDYSPEQLQELKNKIIDRKISSEDQIFSLYLLQLSKDPLKNQLLNEVIDQTDGRLKTKAIQYKSEANH